MSDTVNVDTLERGALRALPEDSAEYSVLMARQCVSDLAARAREGETRVGNRGDATQDAIDRLARRVAELEAALREVERYFGSELPPAGFPLGAVRAALTGDGSGA